MTPPTGNEPWWWLIYALILVPLAGFVHLSLWPWLKTWFDGGRAAALAERDQVMALLREHNTHTTHILIEQHQQTTQLLTELTQTISSLARTISELRIEQNVEKRISDYQARQDAEASRRQVQHDAEIERVVNLLVATHTSNNGAGG